MSMGDPWAAQLQILANNPWATEPQGRLLKLELDAQDKASLPFPSLHDQLLRSGSGELTSSGSEGAPKSGGKPLNAQKRFRERAKENLSSLEAQVERKAAEHQRLALENSQV
jgi:hypothetical protein